MPRSDTPSSRAVEPLASRAASPESAPAAGQAAGHLAGPAIRPAPALVLRDPQPGDMGWVVHRQALLYWHEYGWGVGFEALVAGIVARFVQGFDATRERCWIAEIDGRIVGSVFLVRESDEEGKLRLLYVEAETRGLGVGARLVDACIAEARTKGYRRLTLWTNDVLAAARRIYQTRGFRLVREEAHRSFGHELTGQYWKLDL
jgi:GNAT superfamily N-acetyltransferase